MPGTATILLQWYAADTDEWIQHSDDDSDWLAAGRARVVDYNEVAELNALRSTMNWPVVLFQGAETTVSSAITLAESIAQAYHEACTDNWDGYGGKRVSPATYARALDFARALPPVLPAPDVQVHPDGEIAFEWHRGPNAVLTASISATGEVSYAALFSDGGRLHGTERMANDVPEVVSQGIARLFRA